MYPAIHTIRKLNTYSTLVISSQVSQVKCVSLSVKKKTSLSPGFCLLFSFYSLHFVSDILLLFPVRPTTHSTTRHDTTLSSFCFVFCAHLDPLHPTVLPSVTPLISGCCAHCFPIWPTTVFKWVIRFSAKVCTLHFIGNGKEAKCGTAFRQKGSTNISSKNIHDLYVKVYAWGGLWASWKLRYKSYFG